MSASGESTNFPTMIIPRGTEIKVNAQGQLSIKTPGNLVIQNSGLYSELESTNGSIRIEENVTVEAVSIRAAQACFIQGTLTAWRVHAKRIALEDRARAFIMLQESEQLELSKTSRLVGNFGSEKELFLMLGKFSGQLKELPGGVDMHSGSHLIEQPASFTPPPPPPPSVQPPPPPPAPQGSDLSPQLRTALTLLEREVGRPDLEPRESDALRALVYALRERNVQRAALVYRDVFAEVRTMTDGLREAQVLLNDAFGSRA